MHLFRKTPLMNEVITHVLSDNTMNLDDALVQKELQAGDIISLRAVYFILERLKDRPFPGQPVDFRLLVEGAEVLEKKFEQRPGETTEQARKRNEVQVYNEGEVARRLPPGNEI